MQNVCLNFPLSSLSHNFHLMDNLGLSESNLQCSIINNGGKYEMHIYLIVHLEKEPSSGYRAEFIRNASYYNF